jgi:pimeloyl-ACP methyl ester carboxylesterase
MLASRQIIYDDRKINLYESPGNGTPVLLIHGNSSSATSFSSQLLGQLGNTHRLLAFDLIFSPNLSEAEAFAWVSFLMAPNSSAPLQHTLVNDILATDPQARVLLGKLIERGEYLDETELLSHLPTPIAIVHGVCEQIVKKSYFQSLTVPNLWRNKPQIINNAGHFVHFEQPEAFNLVVTEFIESCDRMKT